MNVIKSIVHLNTLSCLIFSSLIPYFLTSFLQKNSKTRNALPIVNLFKAFFRNPVVKTKRKNTSYHLSIFEKKIKHFQLFSRDYFSVSVSMFLRHSAVSVKPSHARAFLLSLHFFVNDFFFSGK
jgi:hypothetical protein